MRKSPLRFGLVVDFIGATNGIGEYSLKERAHNVQKPLVYYVGRSQEAGDRITGECRGLNRCQSTKRSG